MPELYPAAAHGAHTDHGRPHGYSSLTPFVVAADPRALISFCQEVFGAQVVGLTEMPVDGQPQVAHAELDFGHGRLQLGCPNPAYGLVLAELPADAITYSLAIYVPDVDAAVARAVARGARVREPAASFVSGDRFASIVGPSHIRWSVMTRVEDLSDEESQRRIAEWARGFSVNS